MRTPDQDELPGDGDSSQGIGEGFGGVSPEQLPTYGDDFYSEYEDTYEEDTSSSDEEESDETVVEDDDSDVPDGDMTEEEAEVILEDVLEEDYGEDADEVAADLQEDTGMSAVEILEDLTGLDLDSSDDGDASYSADFDRAMADAAEAEATTTTSDLFNEDMPSESDYDINGDGVVDADDFGDGPSDNVGPARFLDVFDS